MKLGTHIDGTGNLGLFILGSILIFSAALYRPLTMIADNAWDISAPQYLLLLGAMTFLMAFVPYLALVWLGFRALPVALGLSGILLVLLLWNSLEMADPVLWLTVVVIFGIAGYFWLNDGASRVVAYVAIAIFGVTPIVQVILGHIIQSDPYPIVELAPRDPAVASEAVEDVLFVVVDTYPGPVVAGEWLDHDPGPLRKHLADLGYTVWDNAFSQFTFTSLSVPSMLELQPITTPDLAATPWGNRSTTYEIIRGENLVAATLRSAGYQYIHLESGWDAGACGDVDRCYPAPFLKELTWAFLRPTVIGDWMVRRYGAYSVGASVNVAANLVDLAPIFDDENHDYVYAHMLLPHPPIVVDSQCVPDVPDLDAVVSFDPENPGGDDRERFDAQLTCVDGLISEVAAIAGPRTAVLITGDHGTSTNGQVGTAASTWSDSDIAERLSIFLAYRMPTVCAPPAFETNIEAMKAIMVCATDIDPPANNGMYLIESRNPEWADPEHMSAIVERLAAHEIEPEPAP